MTDQAIEFYGTEISTEEPRIGTGKAGPGRPALPRDEKGEIIRPEGYVPPTPKVSMDNYSELFEEITDLSLAKIKSILKLQIPKSAKHYAQLTTLQGQMAQNHLGLLVKIDESRLKSQNVDRLGQILEKLNDEERRMQNAKVIEG